MIEVNKMGTKYITIEIRGGLWTKLYAYWSKGAVGHLGCHYRNDGPYCTLYRLYLPFEDDKWVHHYYDSNGEIFVGNGVSLIRVTN